MHHSGTWATMIHDGKASLQSQQRSRVNSLKKICMDADMMTRKTVAVGLVLSKIQYLLPFFGAAPDYLLRGLQVQQMAAARAVLGRQSSRWNNRAGSFSPSWSHWLLSAGSFSGHLATFDHSSNI